MQELEKKQAPFMRLSLDVVEQMVVSQFTDSQRRILQFIHRLSLGCDQEWAQVPHQKDFEIVGIGKNHIKDPLDWLLEAKVIERDGELYRVNPDFDQWRVSRVQGFKADRMKKLVHLNLSRRAGTAVPLKGTQGGEKFPQKELYGAESSHFGNQKVPTLGTAPATDLATAIDSITGNDYSYSRESSAYSLFLQAHENRISPLTAEELGLLIDKYSDADVAAAIREAIRSNKPCPSVNYLERILENRKNGSAPPQNHQGHKPRPYSRNQGDVPWYDQEHPGMPLVTRLEPRPDLEGAQESDSATG